MDAGTARIIAPGAGASLTAIAQHRDRDEILDEVIQALIAYRRSQLTAHAPQPVPVLSASQLVGDSRVLWLVQARRT